MPNKNGSQVIRPRPAKTSDRHRRGRRIGLPEVFKLLGDASDNQRPSTPCQLYLAIASIFSFSVCKVKEFLKPNRPYINAQIGSSITAALYHSGTDISCISEKHFRKIPVVLRPSKILQQKIDPCFSAGGGQLSVKGIVNLPVEILGKHTVHPFCVIHGLNENLILGADFINKHLLVYDPKFKQVQWRKDNVWSVSSVKMTHETVIPEYSSKLVKVKTDSGTENTGQVVAEISCSSEPYLVGGPGLINIDDHGCTLIEVFNAGPEPIVLNRGQKLAKLTTQKDNCCFLFKPTKLTRLPSNSGETNKNQWRMCTLTFFRCATSKCPVNTETNTVPCLLNTKTFSV